MGLFFFLSRFGLNEADFLVTKFLHKKRNVEAMAKTRKTQPSATPVSSRLIMLIASIVDNGGTRSVVGVAEIAASFAM